MLVQLDSHLTLSDLCVLSDPSLLLAEQLYCPEWSEVTLTEKLRELEPVVFFSSSVLSCDLLLRLREAAGKLSTSQKMESS